MSGVQQTVENVLVAFGAFVNFIPSVKMAISTNVILAVGIVLISVLAGLLFFLYKKFRFINDQLDQIKLHSLTPEDVRSMMEGRTPNRPSPSPPPSHQPPQTPPRATSTWTTMLPIISQFFPGPSHHAREAPRVAEIVDEPPKESAPLVEELPEDEVPLAVPETPTVEEDTTAEELGADTQVQEAVAETQ